MVALRVAWSNNSRLTFLKNIGKIMEVVNYIRWILKAFLEFFQLSGMSYTFFPVVWPMNAWVAWDTLINCIHFPLIPRKEDEQEEPSRFFIPCTRGSESHFSNLQFYFCWPVFPWLMLLWLLFLPPWLSRAQEGDFRHFVSSTCRFIRLLFNTLKK